MSMARLGVIGNPAAHSLSPVIHRAWLSSYDIEGRYEIIETSDFIKHVRACQAQGWRGLNVTLPYKGDAYEICDECDEAAVRTKAVNCLLFESGRIFGFNTDVAGFILALDEEAPLWRNNRHAILLLGAGGVARAIVYALATVGFDNLHVVNRSAARAHALGEVHKNMNLKIYGYDDNIPLNEIGLVINATSMGMKNSALLPFSLEGLDKDVIIFDSIYTPLETDLLKEGRARAMICVNGLGMLIHQARVSFAHWFDIFPSVHSSLRATLERAL